MISIGVDAHKSMHVALAVDDAGREVGNWQGPNSEAGWRSLASWANGLGVSRLWGIEGAWSNGRGLAQYLVDTTKVYDATIELGRETDTYDADGAVVHRADASHVGREAVEAALSSFRGEIEQVPPRFSAIKRLGLPLYKRARRGETVEAPPRRVRVDRLDIISYDAPVLRVEIECGKGFYVRSLAHDLGASLGVGGCLTALRRARVGPFRVEDAVSFDTLGRELASGAWLDRLLPPDEVLLGWRAAILGEASAQRLAHGRSLLLQPLPGVVVSAGERCRAYSAGGDFLAVLRCAAPQEWRPEKVFLAQSA